MRHKIGWMLLVLGLTQLAATAGAAASTKESPVADSEGAIERAAPPAEAAPALDLHLVPRQPPVVRDRPIRPAAIPAEPLDRFSASQQDGDGKGLSFGLEVRRRPQLERRAWQVEDDAPGLRDDIERVIEHSTLGVRGTYRF